MDGAGNVAVDDNKGSYHRFLAPLPLIKGLAFTLKTFFTKPITYQYPEQKREPAPLARSSAPEQERLSLFPFRGSLRNEKQGSAVPPIRSGVGEATSEPHGA